MTSLRELFWVNCNRCAVALFSVEDGVPVKMFVANCGCIFCSHCASISTKPRCVVCGCSTVKLLPIGRKLPTHALEMFNTNLTSLGKMNKRKSFQNMQFDRTLKVLWRQFKKLVDQTGKEAMLERRRQAELDKLDRKIGEKQGVVAGLEKINRQLEQQLRRRQQKPREGGSGQETKQQRQGRRSQGQGGRSKNSGFNNKYPGACGGIDISMYPPGSVISPPEVRPAQEQRQSQSRHRHNKPASSFSKNWKSGAGSFLFF